MSCVVFADKDSDAPAPRGRVLPKASLGGIRVNDPNDSFEQEADGVAATVVRAKMGASDWSLSRAGSNTPLQRKCACQEAANVDGECEHCKEERLIRREAVGPEENTASRSVNRVLGSSGQPLNQSTREFFEPRLGFNFAAVRVHTDRPATQSARLLKAAAYTLGNHIVFGSGYYSPESLAGTRLLAHELVHTIQQSKNGRRHAVIQRQTTESTGPTGIGGKARYLFEDLRSVVSPDRWKKARACLESLLPSMKSLTFESWIPTACARSKSKVLQSREWDAFGHCWIACEGTRRCGGAQTWIYGLGREVSREWESRTGGPPHDSLTQDISNQLIGRTASVKEGTCFSICDELHKSGLLNLTAPERKCVDCATYPASGSEGPCPGAAAATK